MQNILEYPRIYDDTFSLQKAMRSMTMKDNLHRVNKKERERNVDVAMGTVKAEVAV